MRCIPLVLTHPPGTYSIVIGRMENILRRLEVEKFELSSSSVRSSKAIQFIQVGQDSDSEAESSSKCVNVISNISDRLNSKVQIGENCLNLNFVGSRGQ